MKQVMGMHLIPQSWAHWHILLSVFPSVGLIFALGFYVTGLVADNELMKRSGLAVLAALGVLALPTYLSGDRIMAALSNDSRIPTDLMAGHFVWGMVALAALTITGIAAVVALWRGRSLARLPQPALRLVLALAAVTLALMMVAGELGWQVNHHELRLEAAAQRTPQVWSHAHMILNHFPTVGFLLALAFYVIGLARKNVVTQRTSLVIFVLCSILGVPTYVSGAASMWAFTDSRVAGISRPVIEAHRDMALATLFGLAFTGVAAWIELWRFRHLGRFSRTSLYLILGFAIITLAVMAETGHRGGQINHPEIRTAAGGVPGDPQAGVTRAIELLINHVIWFVPWQTVHFFGFSLIFGTVLVISLRVLGFWKSVSFAAVHRLLPLGVFGVVMNVFSGMLILLADSSRYLNAPTFAPKIGLIVIGAAAVLYFSFSERLWKVRAEEDAPASAKWVAALVLISWSGVIMGGRLISYL
jgi:uncharacterized membrane protein